MKRLHVVLLAAVGCLCLSNSVAGQMGMNIFRKPNIADIFKPVVGNGAAYEMQGLEKDKGPTQMEMTVVGQELVDGQQGYWMEMGHVTGKTGGMMYMKMLVTKDFEYKKIVFQQPGQPAMEMPYGSKDDRKNYVKEELEKWHQVGTETITVPAGRFSCAHWKKDEGVGDAWVSDKVSPMGLIKSVNDGRTMVLTKVITGATDHITGPVTKFDPQAMRQQRQEP